MDPDDFFIGAGTNQLHLTSLTVRSNCSVHGGKGGSVDLNLILTEALFGLRLCQPHGANWRVAEDHSRDAVIVHLGIRHGAKETL